jgi:ABC transporter fused permease/ATP-binding protein
MANGRRRVSGDVDPEDKKKVTRERLSEALALFGFIRPYRWYFIAGMLFLMLSTGASLTFPFFIGRLADVAVEDLRDISNLESGASGLDLNSVNAIAIFLGVILVIQSVFSFLRIYFFAQVSERAMADIRTALYQKLITLPIPFFEQHRVGELTSRISADVSQLQDVLSFTLAELLRQAFTLIGGIIVLVYISGKLTLFMVLTFPVMVILALVFGRFIRRLSKTSQDRLAEANVIVEETLQAVNIVKAFTSEWREIGRYRTALGEVVRHALKAATFRGAFVSFIIFAIFGGIVLVIWFGASMVQDGGLTIGRLIAFVFYTVFIGASVGGMGDLYGVIQKALGSSERIREIMREDSELEPEAPEDLSSLKLKGHIRYESVHFAYPTRPDMEVLHGLSLEVNPGEKIALVGQSGAGKSTIVQLLLRFYEIQQGQILVDGKNVSQYPVSQYRRNVGIVPQEVILFGGTIRENIAYGKPDATEQEITDAARKANAWEFVTRFPEKLDTVVGERGVKLSGGQRQRIAIARAILKDPAILILDEATSSLDAESENLVQEALDKLMQGRTTIIIAHRLSTIRKVDTIYVVDNGQILEKGSHEYLSGMEEGTYAKLLRLQFEDAG